MNNQNPFNLQQDQSLDTKMHSPIQKRLFQELPKQCIICLDLEEEEVTFTTQCNHIYHNSCLVQWFPSIGNKCLACRYNLPRIPLNNKIN